ncbi:hypothetical protein KDL01_41640 [Actinospica durhamensis]|uniref:Uncharacterized protein n=1 Tax=Actinospica durhamensis TaxID=1508375 RepID=A0A941IWP9_9ACTN|nr:hypothetical protein [Actinospica durhamensis]MBR7839816.1 hypothetical protein [Actinospica durhamensis]
MLRWLKRRTSKRADVPADEDVQAAQEELRNLEQAMAAAHERTSEIREISRTLRSLGERNHFAPLIRDALKGEFR